MKGGGKGVSMLRDNVHDSTGGWDMSIECFLLLSLASVQQLPEGLLLLPRLACKTPTSMYTCVFHNTLLFC